MHPCRDPLAEHSTGSFGRFTVRAKNGKTEILTDAHHTRHAITKQSTRSNNASHREMITIATIHQIAEPEIAPPDQAKRRRPKAIVQNHRARSPRRHRYKPPIDHEHNDCKMMYKTRAPPSVDRQPSRSRPTTEPELVMSYTRAPGDHFDHREHDRNNACATDPKSTVSKPRTHGTANTR